MSKANEALDKKAENARELGLDYEPSSVSKLAREAGLRDCTCNGALGCLERFAEFVRADERNRLATKLVQDFKGAFGDDTCASWAVWIREQK